MKLKRPMRHATGDSPPTIGTDVQISKWGLHRYGTLGPAGEGFFPRPATGFTKTYGYAMFKAVRVMQRLEMGAGNPEIHRDDGDIDDQATFNVIWEHLNAYQRGKYAAWQPLPLPKPKPPVPELGPVVLGQASLLNLRLTHPTEGIPGYPAIDIGWSAGLDVLAVEDVRVTEASSANVGDAFYAEGESGIEYWYGHLVVAPPVGRTFSKGQKVADIIWHPNGSHVHFGMDTRALIGHGLVYGYSSEIPTVGTQLRKALA